MPRSSPYSGQRGGRTEGLTNIPVTLAGWQIDLWRRVPDAASHVNTADHARDRSDG
jgi:hypothetical protein